MLIKKKGTLLIELKYLTQCSLKKGNTFDWIKIFNTMLIKKREHFWLN